MKKIILTGIAAILFYNAHAQKAQLISGSLDALKGIKKLNILYDYDSMSVGELATENEFIIRRKSYLTKNGGDKWEKIWKDDRRNRFEPKFKKVFAEYCDITVDDYPNERYTLIFKTTHTEPGFNVGVWHGRAEIDGEARIVETANPANIIAKISVRHCEAPDKTNDFDSGVRLEIAYALAAKKLGKLLSKELK